MRRPVVAALAGVFLSVMASAAVPQVAIGSAAPLRPLRGLDGSPSELSDLAGPRGLVAVFWAAWSKRSIEQLRRLEGVYPALRDHGVGLVAVNVESHRMTDAAMEPVRAVVERLALSFPVLVDEDLALFEAYRVVAVPSSAVIGPDGTLRFFLAGYPAAGREALFDEIDRLAGFERSRPAASETRAAAAAIRRLQFGRAQLAGGRVAAARATFETAVEADPGFADPLVELAALALEEEADVEAARALLARAEALQPDHPGVRLERARLALAGGALDEARAALEAIAAEWPDEPTAHAYLGFVLAAAGDAGGAAAAFARAAEAGPDPGTLLHTGESTTAQRAMKATAVYRRARLSARR